MWGEQAPNHQIKYILGLNTHVYGFIPAILTHKGTNTFEL